MRFKIINDQLYDIEILYGVQCLSVTISGRVTLFRRSYWPLRRSYWASRRSYWPFLWKIGRKIRMKGAHVKAFSGHLNVQVRNDICMFASTTFFNFHPLLQDLRLYPYLLFFRVWMPGVPVFSDPRRYIPAVLPDRMICTVSSPLCIFQ